MDGFLSASPADWLYLGYFSIAIVLLLALGQLAHITFGVSIGHSRKAIHMGTGFLVAVTPLLIQSKVPLMLLSGVFVVVNLADAHRGLLRGIHSPEGNTYGTLFFPLAVLLLALVYWEGRRLIFIGGVLVMAVSDPAAALVGEGTSHVRKYRLWRETKSLEGSVAMFITTFLVLVATLSAFSGLDGIFMPTRHVVWFSLVAAILAAVFEAFSANGSDNLTVPLGVGIVLNAFIASPDIRVRFTLGVAFAAAVALAAYRTRSLDLSGAVATFGVGVIIVGFGGVQWTLPILAFFVLSSLLSHIRETRGASLTSIMEKGSRRDAHQVLANGGVASLCVLMAYHLGGDMWYLAYLGAVAAATADTWGTEIGILMEGRPRSILTWKPVGMGTSGGVSARGLAGAAAGSALIALVGALVHPLSSNPVNGVRLVALVFLAGVAGSLVDSLLGATVQAKLYCGACGTITERRFHCQGLRTRLVSGWHWIDNDVVNLGCGLSGALIVGAGLALGHVS